MNLNSRIRKKIKESKEQLSQFTPPRSEHKVTRSYKDKTKYSRKEKYKNDLIV